MSSNHFLTGDPFYEATEKLLRIVLPTDVAVLVCEYAMHRGCYDGMWGVCENPLHYRHMSCCGARVHLDQAFHSDLPPRGCCACQQNIGYPMQCDIAGCACHYNPIITHWYTDD